MKRDEKMKIAELLSVKVYPSIWRMHDTNMIKQQLQSHSFYYREKLVYLESQVKWAPKVQGGQLESKGEMVYLEEMANLEPRDHLGHQVHLVRL